MTRRFLISFVLMLAFLLPGSAALIGDFDGDGEVGFADFIAFVQRYGSRIGDALYDARFDLDEDGQIAFSDFLFFSAAYGSLPKDLRNDPIYLRQQVKHISDADLFAAMDLDRPGLEAVKLAVSNQDYDAAYRAWGHYWASRPGFAYVNSGTPFHTVEEAEKTFAGSTAYTAAADRVAAHNITGWGDVTIQHGPVVDFNANYGDSGKYGFHYWGWSAPLLWAYLATGRTAYLDAFDRLFNQWYEQRDEVLGAFAHLDVIWYELGLGSNRNRVFLDFYRLNRNRTSAQTHERMLKNFLGSARWLHELQQQGYRSGNWQVMGSYALAELGLNFPEFKESVKWIAVGVHRMEEHLQRDFFADGCHSERCPSSYSTIVYRDPRNLAFLLERFGGHDAAVARMRPPLERTLSHWMYLLSPLGTQPAVNDGGRGRFDASIFAEGGRAFNRPDLLWVARHLLNAGFDDPVEMPMQTSVDFRPSGFAVMRGDWTRESPYMVINYGPYGGGHSHADMLSFELFAYGRAMAVDAGIGISYDDPLHRPWYITSKAHNMLVVDDANLNRINTVGEHPIWSAQEPLDYFSAEHRGYGDRGVEHRRHFLFVKPTASLAEAMPYFLVFDAYTASHGRRISHMLHTPMTLRKTGAHLISTESPGLLVASPDPVSLREGMGMAHLGGVSTPARREIPWVAFDRISAGNPEDMAVLYFPFPGQSPPAISVGRLFGGVSGKAACLTVAHRDIVDYIAISDGQERTFANGVITTDARCAIVRLRPNGSVAHFAVVAGRRLTFNGRVLLDSPQPVNASAEVSQ